MTNPGSVAQPRFPGDTGPLSGRHERLLRKTLFFRNAPAELLSELAQRCVERDLAPGELLCAAGDPGDALYVVAQGELEVFLDEALLDVSGPGECLGEMALLTGEARSASLRARDRARVLELSLPSFRHALEQHPELTWGIFRELAAKMQSSIQVRVEQDRVKRQLESAFVRSVSRAVMDELLSHADPGVLLAGQARTATVLFSDVRGFTGISEEMPPAEIVQLLNEYLSAMVEVIMDCGGTLDKIMGDGILAHFGIPLSSDDDVGNALRCVAEMFERLTDLNRAGVFVSQRPLEIGVGLATGELVAGCVGSENYMEYTAIGDVVNLASRLEGLTKHYRVPVIFCEQTAAACSSRPDLRRIDRVRVKGRATPTDLYTLDLTPRDDAGRLTRGFSTAFELYEKGRFDDATESLRELTRRFPEDGPTAVLEARCQRFAAAPPDGWDGVFSHLSK